MKKLATGRIVAAVLRSAMCGVIAVAGVAVATMANASPTLEICIGGGGCPALAPQAGPFPPVPPGPIPANGGMTITANEPSPFPQIPVGTKGFANNYLYLSDPGHATDLVTFQLLGHGDATLNNTFMVLGTPITWTTAGTPVFTSLTVALPANQLLPFLFISPAGPPVMNDGHNNPVPGAPPGTDFFLSLDQTLLNQGTAGFIGFSDGGGAAGGVCGAAAPGIAPEALADCDFQDMVIRVSVVPEPATLLLLGMGLAGLAVVTWSRHRRT